MFVGDAEGLQVLEQAQVKGMPSKREMGELSKIIERPVLKLLEKNQNFGPTSIVDILLSISRSKYTRQEL